MRSQSTLQRSKALERERGGQLAVGAGDAVVNSGVLSDEDLRKVKTGLTKKDFDHYRELVKPKEAERFWDIRPAAAEKGKIVSIEARG